MQDTINKNIQEINRNIIRINSLSNYTTPYLHSTIEINVPVKRAGTRKRYHYFKLADGIHPTDQLNKKIKIMFEKAIHANIKKWEDAGESEDSDEEPKRSWKY